MSSEQINLIVSILKDKEKNLTETYFVEIANEILAKLKQQQEEKAEVQRKEQDKGLNPNASCSGCYRPNMACKC